MQKGFFRPPAPKNETVLNYAPGSPERKALQAELKRLKSVTADIPMYIGGDEVRTGNLHPIHPPHELSHLLGHYHQGDGSHVQEAVEAALAARKAWNSLPWENRAAVFLKAPT